MFKNNLYIFISNLLKQVPLIDKEYYDIAEKTTVYNQMYTGKEDCSQINKSLYDFLEKTKKEFVFIDVSINEGKIHIKNNSEIIACLNVNTTFIVHIINNDDISYNIQLPYLKNVTTWKQIIDPWNVRAGHPDIVDNVLGNCEAFIPYTICPKENEIQNNEISLDINLNNIKNNIKLNVKWIKSYKLTIESFENNKVSPCMIKVKTNLGMYQVPLNERNHLHVLPNGVLPFFYAGNFLISDGVYEIYLPEGENQIEVYKGFEYSHTVKEININTDLDIQFEMTKAFDLFNEGWVSSDTHVHWADRWVYLGDDSPLLSKMQRARDLHVISVLELSQFDGYQEVFTPCHHPMGIIEEHSNDDYIMYMDEEYRSLPYGHLNVLGLNKMIVPVSTGDTKHGDAPDFPDNFHAGIEAHKQNAIVMCSHGIRDFDRLMIIKGYMDAVDQASASDYYEILNCGFKIPLTCGSDANAREMGVFSTFVNINGKISYEKWIESIKKGKTFVTTRPLLKFKVNNRDIGETILLKDKKIHVKASTYCDIPLKKIEVVYNGDVLLSINNPNDLKTIDIDEHLEISESGWIAFRCSIDDRIQWIEHPGCAHSSPVYIKINGKEMKPKAKNVNRIIDGLVNYKKYVKDSCKFDNMQQKNTVLSHIDEGIELFTKLL